MPCLVVAELEKLLLRQEDTVQICILGQLLWCFHAASRWSDALRPNQTATIVAIGTEVSGLLWAEVVGCQGCRTWKGARALIFHNSRGRWSLTPMSSSEAGGYLQDFVEKVRPLMEPLSFEVYKPIPED